MNQSAQPRRERPTYSKAWWRCYHVIGNLSAAYPASHTPRLQLQKQKKTALLRRFLSTLLIKGNKLYKPLLLTVWWAHEAQIWHTTSTVSVRLSQHTKLMWNLVRTVMLRLVYTKSEWCKIENWNHDQRPQRSKKIICFLRASLNPARPSRSGQS